MLRGLLRALTHAGTLLFLTACSAPEPAASKADPIVNGEPSPPGPEDGVLILLANPPDGTLCSAALLAPNLVVTARHCVAGIIQGDFICQDSGELENGGGDAGYFTSEYAPENLVFFGGPPRRNAPLAKGRAIVSTVPTHVCVNDVAFVVLDRALALPSLPLRRGAPAVRGERITVVGYGPPAQEILRPETAPRGRKAGITVEAVGPDSALDGVTSVAPRSFITSGAYACYGDSGAPAIAEADGAVIGVYSTQQGSNCLADDVVNHFVHLPAYQSLIDEAFAMALDANGTEPAGEAGHSGAAGAEHGEGGGRANGGASGDTGGVETGGSDASGGAPRGAGATPSWENGAGVSAGGAAGMTMPATKDASGCALCARGQGAPYAEFMVVALALRLLRRRRGCAPSGS